MERIIIQPRENWQQRVESLGFMYHTIDGETYWDESVCYRFTAEQIDRLDLATTELQRLAVAAAEYVIENRQFDRLGIPPAAVPLIIASWELDDPSLYGRFDLSWDGTGDPKLLEYNADTPTSLLEASVVQWFWLQDVFPDRDQFNSIHEKLIASWRDWPGKPAGCVHFACASESPEDLGNLEYLRDTAVQAGLETSRLFIEEIGWDALRRRFVDLDNMPISTLFKLYPWEWLVMEEFGPCLRKTGMMMIEPAWKMVLSNKGILPILWELFPGHPNLLEATFADRPLQGDFVKKPLLSREGENITLCRGGTSFATPGSYDNGRFIYQKYAPLPDFNGNFPVIGAWVIGGESAGIGIREDTLPVTTNSSRFIPHYFT